MTTMVEAAPPWMRDLSRLLRNEAGPGAFLPPADLLVDEEGVTVYMDVPGVMPDGLEIELENDTLMVRGQRPWPYGEDAAAVTRRIERSFGSFERMLRVPSGLDPNMVDASLAHGVLTLRVPKPESLKPHRIEIHAEDETRQVQPSGT